MVLLVLLVFTQESTFYRGDLTQYGGNIYRHKIGVTTNVFQLKVVLVLFLLKVTTVPKFGIS